MKENRRLQNSIRNVSYGLLVTVVNTLLSFANRTVFVKILGNEALGLNGLFTEIITILSLTELGIGMAIIYHLYRPFQEEDYKRVSQLMSLYRSAYNMVALVVLGLGILITPIVDRLVTEINYPTWYIKFVFFLFVVKSAVTYLYAYKTVLLNVDQKQYIVSVGQTLFKIIFTVVNIILLILTHNYIVYLLLAIVQSVLPNYALSRYVDRKYPYIDYCQKLSKTDRNEIFTDIKDIFLKRISGVITSSTDNVLISTLVSTIQVGLYSNYVVLFSVIRTLKNQFTHGISASIGNLNVTEKAEKCKEILSNLTFLYFVFSMLMCSGLVAVGNQFIAIWLGKEYVMGYAVLITAVFNLYLEIICDPLWQYLEVSGLFKWDKYIGIIGSTVNLAVSVILGMRIGIVGIFIGTICTQVIQIVLKTALLFRRKFMLPAMRYYKMWMKIIACFIISVIIQKWIGQTIIIENLYMDFFLKGVLSVVTSSLIAVISFLKTEEFRYAVNMFMRFIRKG